MPSGSTVVIRYDGTDITNHVLFATARFESQMAALPGTCEFTVKDEGQTLSFVSGKEITLDIDGVRVWGGYLMQPRQIFAFPVDKVIDPATVKTRQWALTAVDYNIMLDKRVLRNPADYLSHLPFFKENRKIGELLRNEIFSKYIDVPDGFDTTSEIDDVVCPHFDVDGNEDCAGGAVINGSFKQQGTKLRDQMDAFAQYGAVYYVGPDKKVHLHAIESTLANWGFSDKPNNHSLPTGSGSLATYGFREFEGTEDINQVANDAFVWGGSEWAGAGGTVFARRQNAASIAAHNRWQYAETRFGELNDQGQVSARANTIVSGNVGGQTLDGVQRGLSNPQFQIRVAWFGHSVPTLSGQKAHMLPPQVATFILYTMGSDAAHPLIQTLPLRTVRITFPQLKEDGTAYVRFDGFFGVQLSDPYWLWKFLRDAAGRKLTLTAGSSTGTITTASNTSTSTAFGALGQFFPAEAPNGSLQTFTLPQPFVAGTSEVYINGLLQQNGASYVEVDPASGQIRFFEPPYPDDIIWVVARVASGGG